MASTETRARLRIKKALEENGHYVVTLHGDATSGRGRSDLVVCAGGLYFWMEVKTLDGSPSPAQLRRIREVRLAGGTACLITSIREARWVIETRQKGYVPYMADEPGVNILDLSSFQRVEVVPDPDAIPFPDPPKADPATAITLDMVNEAIAEGTKPPVPDHIVPETGEIIEPADAELDSMLASVSSRIAAQQANAPPLPLPVVEPEEPAKRKRRTRAEIEAEKQQAPLPETLTEAMGPVEVPPWNPATFTGPLPQEAHSAEGPTLQSIYDTLLTLWDAVSRIDTTLTTEMGLLEKLINEGGAT